MSIYHQNGDSPALPLPQLLTLGRLAEEHPDSTWHLNDCGCCVCLHPGGDTTRGYIIGADGDYDLHAAPHD